jgi:hypothetical protein
VYHGLSGTKRERLISKGFLHCGLVHEFIKNRTRIPLKSLAIPAGFEPATHGVEIRYSNGLKGVLDDLAAIGHLGGVIEVGKLHLRVAQPGDPFWRCESCERVHLHRGEQMCTRCYAPLPDVQTGTVDALWGSNFLGRRIVRGHDQDIKRFRLRCEELTGQTEDFSDRLRRFKDIFVGQTNEVGRLAEEIDMLSVTTTMEVGIDIGSLQTVYQANMPPQRFNYQQRVGRAGRRGQAFSFVTTFCRGRSHDAFYFRHPESITGDAPPPPFLAVDHDPIPHRLLRKVWLRAAFAVVRDDCITRGEPFPGDDLVPPDVHGEYVPTGPFYDVASPWPDRLLAALRQTQPIRDGFVNSAVLDQEQRARLLAASKPETLIGEIMAKRDAAPRDSAGLAQFLAEQGLLPMYGMPTRVRNLYLEMRTKGRGSAEELSWLSMDRDLEMAIFEFAPGSLLVKDKEKHKAIGFTGSLLDPERRGKNVVVQPPMTNWVSEYGFVGWCPACGAATHERERPNNNVQCDDCRGDVLPGDFRHYISPSAFRTDFRPEEGDVDEVGVMSTRTVATVAREGKPQDVGSIRIHAGAGTTIMQLNDGRPNELGEQQLFEIEIMTDQEVATYPRGVHLPTQAIDTKVSIEVKNRRFLRTDDGIGQFGLFARKATDAVFVEAMRINERLNIDLVAKAASGIGTTAGGLRCRRRTSTTGPMRPHLGVRDQGPSQAKSVAPPYLLSFKPELVRGVRHELRRRRFSIRHLERAKRPPLQIEGVDRDRADAWRRNAQAFQNVRIGAPKRVYDDQSPVHVLLPVGLYKARETHGPRSLCPPEPRPHRSHGVGERVRLAGCTCSKTSSTELRDRRP